MDFVDYDNAGASEQAIVNGPLLLQKKVLGFKKRKAAGDLSKADGICGSKWEYQDCFIW